MSAFVVHSNSTSSMNNDAVHDEETAEWHDEELAGATDDKSGLVVFQLPEVTELDLCSNLACFEFY